MRWFNRRPAPPSAYLHLQAQGMRKGVPVQHDCRIIDVPYNLGNIMSLALSLSRAKGATSVKVFDGFNRVIYDWTTKT